jgi:signal transduction histidine kinase
VGTPEAFVAGTDDAPRRDGPSHNFQATRWLRRALWPLVLVAGAGVLAMTVADGGLEAVDTTTVLAVLIGLAFAGSGLHAWGRRPENRLGLLMTVVGCSYLVWQILVRADSSLLFTAGIWLSDAWVVLFVLFLLTFPGGRLTTKFDFVIVGLFATVAFPLELLWLLFFDPGEPGNALLVWSNADVAGYVDWVQRTVIVTASAVLAVTLSRRWILASPPLRRALVPVLAGSAAILLGAVLVVLGKFELEFEAATWVVQGALIAVPLVVLTGILRSRLAWSSVGDLFVELRTDPGPAELRDALAHALRDPSLALAYWVPQFRSWADLNGRAMELPGNGSGRETKVIDRAGAHVAALVHDPALLDEPELLDAVTAAAGIALENARLQAELRARLEELRGSRARIVDAGQTERKRLERNLHDGAQQRLIALSLELGLLEDLQADPETRRRLDVARREIAISLEELRDVARGLHPAVVSGHGLEVALEQLAAGAAVPVRLDVAVGSRLPEHVEVAAFYLVSESLANIGKHAKATSATVEVARNDGQVVVEVVDDGIGGADTEIGSGLRGLADRVEALEGRLRIWSPKGGGTRLRAEIPCAS